MFYIAKALLDSDALRFRKHSGVHGTLGEHFVKAGRQDCRFHRALLGTFNKRIVGDYGVDAVISSDEVQTMITQGEAFLAEARRLPAGTGTDARA